MKNILKIMIIGLCMNLFLSLDYKFVHADEYKKLENSQKIEFKELRGIDPPDEGRKS